MEESRNVQKEKSDYDGGLVAVSTDAQELEWPLRVSIPSWVEMDKPTSELVYH